VEEVTVVIVTTLGNVSSGHVRSLIGFFSLCSWIKRKEGENSVPTDGATDLYLIRRLD
jgi:hypothetical protein